MKFLKSVAPLAAVAALFFVIVSVASPSGPPGPAAAGEGELVALADILARLEAGEVEELAIRGDEVVARNASGDVTRARAPDTAAIPDLVDRAMSAGVEITASPPAGGAQGPNLARLALTQLPVASFVTMIAAAAMGLFQPTPWQPVPPGRGMPALGMIAVAAGFAALLFALSAGVSWAASEIMGASAPDRAIALGLASLLGVPLFTFACVYALMRALWAPPAN